MKALFQEVVITHMWCILIKIILGNPYVIVRLQMAGV